jgi:predicted membrane-bound spermidine synthase
MKLGRKPFLAITFSLFFLSGIAGLIYESIWTHYLKLFLGHAAYAQSLVLVIYMGGMALGSWLASLNSKRIKNMLATYAIAELLIGVSALVFHPIFTTYLSFSYNVVFPGVHSTIIASLYKWVTASLLILPQTILLGATFPLMTGGLVRLFKDSPGYTIAVLYFVNSLGGSLGVLLSGFFLIPKCTLPGTVMTAGIIDIIIAIVVLVLSFYRTDEKKIHKTSSKKDALSKQSQTVVSPKEPVAPNNLTKLMLAFTFGTAASSFVYEIGWIRMLALVLGSSTHAFELMLSTFILGIALGGFFIRKHLDKSSNHVHILAVAQVLMGVFAIVTIIFYSKLFYLMKFIMSAINNTDQGYIMYNIYSQFICMLVMLPATICIGMTLPVITSLLYKSTNDESVVGKVYALNTFGSIVGVLLATHFLMPLIGLKGVLIIGGTIDILIGILILWNFKNQIPLRTKVLLPATGLVVSLFTIFFIHLDPLILSSGVFRHGEVYMNREIVSYRDGKTSSVAVHKRDNVISLSVNGKVDASISLDNSIYGADEFTQLLLAVYPLSYTSKTSDVGIVGLGSGMTAATLLKYDSLKSLDIVEIEPYVIDAAKLMGPKVSNVFTDQRCSIFVEDARSFFSSRQKKYNIIVSEPSNPWVSGVSNLFTKEYFNLIRKHLKKDGMLAQWFHLYEMTPELFASVLKSLGETFTDYKIFIAASDIVILASDTPIPDYPVNDLTKHNWFSPLLKLIFINNSSDFSINYLGSKDFFQPLWKAFAIAPNSDYNPILDLRATKARILDTDASAFAQLTTNIIPIRKLLYADSAFDSTSPSFRPIPSNLYTAALAANHSAKLIFYYISSLGTPAEAHADSVVPGDAAMAVAKIRMTAQDRSVFARKPFTKWSLDLVSATMPFLNKQQMLTIWAFIDKYAAICGTSESSMEVLHLLKALNYEDYTTAIKLSKNVLTQKKFADSQPCRLALTALLVSCIKLQNYEPIEQVWNDLKWQNSLDISQQILCSIAAEKSGGIISPEF